LLIQIRHQKGKIILPIPLFVVEDVLTGLKDLAVVWGRLFPYIKLPGLFSTICLELFRELRRFKNWQLVDISDGKNQVSIKLY